MPAPMTPRPADLRRGARRHGRRLGVEAHRQFLQDDGHTVYRATLTGLGERMHLNSPDVDLQTHINDVVNPSCSRT